MAVCLLVCATLEYRLCKDPEAQGRPLRDFIAEYLQG
jgi:hypothetical protein